MKFSNLSTQLDVRSIVLEDEIQEYKSEIDETEVAS